MFASFAKAGFRGAAAAVLIPLATREVGARGADTWQKGDLSVTPHISLDAPQNWTRSYTLSCRLVLGHGLSLLTAAPPQTGPKVHVST